MIAFCGAGHTWWQTPQPTHTSGRMRGRLSTTSMAPGTGQRSRQAEHAARPRDCWWARQFQGWISAVPIRSGTSQRSTRPASGRWHAATQGRSSHTMQGAPWGSIIGVPAACLNRGGASTMAWCGHASMQAPQRVQPSRKSSSRTAPGGRSTGKARRRAATSGDAGAGAGAGGPAIGTDPPLASCGDWKKAPRNPPRRSARRLRSGSCLPGGSGPGGSGLAGSGLAGSGPAGFGPAEFGPRGSGPAGFGRGGSGMGEAARSAHARRRVSAAEAGSGPLPLGSGPAPRRWRGTGGSCCATGAWSACPAGPWRRGRPDSRSA